MRSGLTDDFRLHDVADAVNLGGGVLIHLGHAEGFRESEDVQESDGVSTVLPLYLHDGVQVDDLLLVLQLVVLDVGASSSQSSLSTGLRRSGSPSPSSSSSSSSSPSSPSSSSSPSSLSSSSSSSSSCRSPCRSAGRGPSPGLPWCRSRGRRLQQQP